MEFPLWHIHIYDIVCSLLGFLVYVQLPSYEMLCILLFLYSLFFYCFLVIFVLMIFLHLKVAVLGKNVICLCLEMWHHWIYFVQKEKKIIYLFFLDIDSILLLNVLNLQGIFYPKNIDFFSFSYFLYLSFALLQWIWYLRNGLLSMHSQLLL